MQNFNELKYFEKYVRDTAKDAINGNICYLCEVKAFNENFSVDVVLKSGDEVSIELSNVPILQSAYIQPFCQKGDLGIIMPLNNSIYLSLIDKENLFNENEREYLFLPIVAKSNALQGGGDVLGIKSPDGDEISIGKGNVSCETTTLKLDATGTIDINGGEIDISATNNLTLKGETKISAESADISIKSTNPLEIGASENLGSMLSDLISALTSLTTTPCAIGSPVTLDTATISKLTEIQAKIKANFK